MKKISIALLVVLLVLMSSINVFAESIDKGNNTPPKDAFNEGTTLPSFEKESQNLNWTQKGNFLVYIGKAYSLPANSPLRSAITYSSSNEKILTISDIGTVTPLKTGVVVIYATQGNVTIGKKLTIKVNSNIVTSDKKSEISIGRINAGTVVCIGSVELSSNSTYQLNISSDSGTGLFVALHPSSDLTTTSGNVFEQRFGTDTQSIKAYFDSENTSGIYYVYVGSAFDGTDITNIKGTLSMDSK